LTDRPAEAPAVVFLHGLARTRLSMERLRRHVEAHGYDTWSTTYPSRTRSLTELAAAVSADIQRDLPGRALIGVTHSMGGIVARHMDLDWRGLVMLAPPNKGSALAASMSDLAAFQTLYGPAGQELAHPPAEWPLPTAPVAIIAGVSGVSATNPVSWLSGALGVFADLDHDGTVTVEEARLQGMVDFVTVDASHTWIMEHPEVREMVLRFAATGRLRAALS